MSKEILNEYPLASHASLVLFCRPPARSFVLRPAMYITCCHLTAQQEPEGRKAQSTEKLKRGDWVQDLQTYKFIRCNTAGSLDHSLASNTEGCTERVQHAFRLQARTPQPAGRPAEHRDQWCNELRSRAVRPSFCHIFMSKLPLFVGHSLGQVHAALFFIHARRPQGRCPSSRAGCFPAAPARQQRRRGRRRDPGRLSRDDC